jgi:hypothetical protein
MGHGIECFKCQTPKWDCCDASAGLLDEPGIWKLSCHLSVASIVKVSIGGIDDELSRCRTPADIVAYDRLHERIEATFGRIQVAGHFGRSHLALEQCRVVRERHVMYVAVWRHAMRLVLVGARARIAEPTWGNVHERHRFFFDKRAEAQAKVLRYVAHVLGQDLSKCAELVFVHAHRMRQVHEEIQVDRIVLGQLIRYVQTDRFVRS